MANKIKIITMVKPSGTEVRLNDSPDNVDAARKLGWLTQEEAEAKKKTEAKKKG